MSQRIIDTAAVLQKKGRKEEKDGRGWFPYVCKFLKFAQFLHKLVELTRGSLCVQGGSLKLLTCPSKYKSYKHYEYNTKFCGAKLLYELVCPTFSHSLGHSSVKSVNAFLYFGLKLADKALDIFFRYDKISLIFGKSFNIRIFP